MNSSVADKTIVSALPPARELRVINWPVRDDPVYALTAFSLVAASAAVVAWVSASRLLGLIVLSALLLTTWRLWMPITCELAPSGITLRCLRWRRRIPWGQVEQVAVVRGGVLLRCRRGGLPAAGLVGCYVPWPHHPHLVADFREYYRSPVRADRAREEGPAAAAASPGHAPSMAPLHQEQRVTAADTPLH